MAQQFEVLELTAVGVDLKIEVGSGGWGALDETSGTDLHVWPPISEDESAAILEKHGAESKLGKLVTESETDERSSSVHFEDRQTQEHIELGIELAKELIALRELRGGIVKASGHIVNSYIVLAEGAAVHEPTASR